MLTLDCWKTFSELFQRQVDLVVESSIQNPYFRQSVDLNPNLVYAA